MGAWGKLALGEHSAQKLTIQSVPGALYAGFTVQMRLLNAKKTTRLK
jgi:hypothetical protein